ncbi:hypothetical protein [Solimonas fluminis]|uniref:hypothetical protein n=1 Tax=Solimonas fluminis TaxID=2086571 RepID=UPI001FAE8E47|nr:hypothetical protein [Solimonas fluminis]
MKPGTAANLLLAALVSFAGFQLHRAVDLLDRVDQRVQAHDVRLAVLEARQQP